MQGSSYPAGGAKRWCSVRSSVLKQVAETLPPMPLSVTRPGGMTVPRHAFESPNESALTGAAAGRTTTQSTGPLDPLPKRFVEQNL